MTVRRWGATLAAAGLVTSCASTPRHFEPQIASGPEDLGAYRQVAAQCQAAVASGQRRNFGSGLGGSVGAGAAATAGGAAATSAAVLAAGATMGEAALVGALLLPYMLVLAPVGAFGYSRVKRSRKETEIKHAMELCLLENGYRVSGWRMEDARTSPKAAASGAP